MKPYSWILKSFTWCGFWRLCSCFAGWTLCASSPSSLKTINCSFTSALKRHRLATNFYHAAYIVTAYHPLYPPLCTSQWYVHPLHHYGRTYNTIQTLSLSTIWCILRPLHHPLPDRYALGAFENSFDHDELMIRKADKIFFTFRIQKERCFDFISWMIQRGRKLTGGGPNSKYKLPSHFLSHFQL